MTVEEKLQYIRQCKREFKTVNWNKLYESEQDLINDLIKIDIDKIKYYYELPKGYEYIKSFRNYYLKNNTLSEAQIKQLKRIAEPIFSYNNK